MDLKPVPPSPGYRRDGGIATDGSCKQWGSFGRDRLGAEVRESGGACMREVLIGSGGSRC